jgi:hypothetical protein
MLTEHVRVRAERQRRGVAELLGELDDGGALLADQQRGERVAELVWPWAAEAGGGRRMELAVAPVVPMVGPPRGAVGPWEDQRAAGRGAGCRLPLGEILGKRLEQVDRALDAVGLLALESAVVDRLLDEQRALADMAPFEPERLAWT